MKVARYFFTKEEEKQIIQSIIEAEKNTSAEIRVHVENFCLGNPVKRAERVFFKHNMHQTKYRNGVLFYIAVWNHKLAVIGDKGIYEKVDQLFWENLVNKMIDAFKKDKDKEKVLCECIAQVGQALANYFPPDDENPDELSNEISY